MILRIFFNLFVLFFTLQFVSACSTTATTNNQLEPTIILISIDGARHDYLDRFNAPHLQSIANSGVRADYLQPVFPSKTFPNHYSLVTGLRPESHGLVNNSMYDPEYDMVFSMRKREEVENPRWWGGEPIWVTAEQQGLTAATFFFPGSETAVKGVRPSYWYNYDGSISNRARVEQVLNWMDMPSTERPRLITLYFSSVDDAGHRFGPNSAEVEASFEAVDAEIGILLAGLAERGLKEQVNIIVASDHGMQEVNPHNYFLLDGSFDENFTEQVVYSREIVSIHPLAGQTDALYEQLTAAIPEDFGLVLRKENMPERFQYTDHRRIGDIILLANPGNIWVRQRWLDELNEADLDQVIGTHGYDNEHSNMFGMFIAQGPQFKHASRVTGFVMVDVYQVMAEILGLKAAANDGNPAVIPLLLETK